MAMFEPTSLRNTYFNRLGREKSRWNLQVSTPTLSQMAYLSKTSGQIVGTQKWIVHREVSIVLFCSPVYQPAIPLLEKKSLDNRPHRKEDVNLCVYQRVYCLITSMIWLLQVFTKIRAAYKAQPTEMIQFSQLLRLEIQHAISWSTSGVRTTSDVRARSKREVTETLNVALARLSDKVFSQTRTLTWE